MDARRGLTYFDWSCSYLSKGDGCPPGVDPGRGLGAKGAGDPSELLLRDDGGKGVFHPHRWRTVLGIDAPNQPPRFLIDTKNCGTRGGWAWRLLKVTAPRLLASDVPTAAPRTTLSLDVNVARAGGRL